MVKTPRSRGTKKTSANDGAAMPLMAHLRELRGRLFKAVLAIAVGTVVAWFFYDPIIDEIIDPFCVATEQFREARSLGECNLIVDSVIGPFVLQLQVSIVAGMLLTSPIWLYQLWRFITPGLHRNERRWSLVFVFTSVPLFIAGVALAFFVLPKGLGVLLEFTPERVEPLIKVDVYLKFMIRTMLVFGIGFLIPIVVVLLNLIGILSAETLKRTRAWTVVGIFIFAAIGTPTGDPITMLAVALPMWLLYECAVIIARINDRRKLSGNEPDYDSLDDDEASAIDAASSIDEPDSIEPPRDD
jgi:sec-independent protein translocase protein TatC